MKAFTILLNEKEYEMLRKLAYTRSKSKGYVVRQIIADYLASIKKGDR